MYRCKKPVVRVAIDYDHGQLIYGFHLVTDFGMERTLQAAL